MIEVIELNKKRENNYKESILISLYKRYVKREDNSKAKNEIIENIILDSDKIDEKYKDKLDKISFYENLSFYDKIVLIKEKNVELIIIINANYKKVKKNKKGIKYRKHYSFNIAGKINNYSFTDYISEEGTGNKIFNDLKNLEDFESNITQNLLKKINKNNLSTMKYLSFTLNNLYKINKELNNEERDLIDAYVYNNYSFLKTKNNSYFSLNLLLEVYIPLLEVLYPKELLFENDSNYGGELLYSIRTDLGSFNKVLLKNNSKENQMKELLPALNKKDILCIQNILANNETIKINDKMKNNEFRTIYYDINLFVLSNSNVYKEELYKLLEKHYDLNKISYEQFKIKFNLRQLKLFKESMNLFINNKKKEEYLLISFLKDYRDIYNLSHLIEDITNMYNKINQLMNDEHTKKKLIIKTIEYIESNKKNYNNLYDFHDAITFVYEILYEDVINIDFKSNNFKTINNEVYELKEVKDLYELKMVGNQMNHCVFSYGDEIKKEKTSIITIRDKGNNNSLVCMEIDLNDKSIKQIKGYNNKQILDKKLLLMINQFKEKNDLKYNTNDNYHDEEMFKIFD